MSEDMISLRVQPETAVILSVGKLSARCDLIVSELVRIVIRFMVGEGAVSNTRKSPPVVVTP
jgi:hypothetical protein